VGNEEECADQDQKNRKPVVPKTRQEHSHPLRLGSLFFTPEYYTELREKMQAENGLREQRKMREAYSYRRATMGSSLAAFVAG
jgi:hypothetical protein